MQPRSRTQPNDFRREEVAQIMQRWRAGESCSLVGVGSVGKSNLLQHISDPATIRHYLGIENPDHFKAITIDPNLLAALPEDGENMQQVQCWAGYELMMHRLYMAFYPFDVLGAEDAERFYNTYLAFQDGSNPLYAYMGLRYFELGLDYFLRRGIRIVFMFDEFEEMMKTLPVKFFLTLRGIRDINKRLLSYLTFTRMPLPSLVEQFDIPMLAIEPFTELFTDNLLYVGPYNELDGQRMAESLMSRNQKNYPDQTVKFLLWSTGRYAGLIRAGFRVIETVGSIDQASMLNDELARKLAAKRPVREECRTIWTSLTPAEHHVLKAAARLTSFASNAETDSAVTLLVQKKLLQADKINQTLEIQPPVFRAFVNTNPEIDID
ncbi:MAG: hypothetical protein H7Y11_13640 [Armatimonadetes bacterium]|nr:hypothetical protein [Anaerolineae bacterium]